MPESLKSPSPDQPRSHFGPWVIVALVTALLVLHQDNWFWLDGRLVLGFIPVGLFWHACISIGASLTWFLATRIAWPLETPAGTDKPANRPLSDSANASEVSS